MTATQTRFRLGRTVATPGALAALRATGEDPATFMDRHVTGDWGNLSDDDKQANEDALFNEERILSAYALADGTRIYIITEADRSYTTLLLSEEY